MESADMISPFIALASSIDSLVFPAAEPAVHREQPQAGRAVRQGFAAGRAADLRVCGKAGYGRASGRRLRPHLWGILKNVPPGGARGKGKYNEN